MARDLVVDYGDSRLRFGIESASLFSHARAVMKATAVFDRVLDENCPAVDGTRQRSAGDRWLRRGRRDVPSVDAVVELRTYAKALRDAARELADRADALVGQCFNELCE